MQTLTKELTLTTKQKEFVLDECRFLAFIGGVGSGKTWAGSDKALYKALKNICAGAIGAPTFRMLRDSTLPAFRERAADVIAEENKTEGIIKLINGSIIYCKTTDNPDYWRGLSLNWIWLDEASYMDAYILPVCQGRLRQMFPGQPPALFITCTPKGKNWIFQEWVEKRSQDLNYKLIRASTFENPFLPKEYAEMLKGNYTGLYLAQELEGEFVTFEGLVYNMFDESIHLWPREEPLPAFNSIAYAIDYGYTNPTAIGVFGIVKPEGKRPFDIQIDEVYKRGLTTENVIDEVLALFKIYGRGDVYVDPSEAGLIASLRKNGINAIAADNDVRSGIQAEQAALQPISGQPGAYIVATCVNTRAEFAQYTFKTKGKGTTAIYLDQPEKTNDHAMDMRRYFRMSQAKYMTMPEIRRVKV